MSTPDDSSAAARRCPGQSAYDRGPGGQAAFVRNGGITAAQFDLSLEQQRALFRGGAQAATSFITGHAATGHLPRGR